jgi:hypothetical protein
MGKIQMDELLSAPANPASGKRLIYPKSDGWYQKDAAGNETKLEGASQLNDLTDLNLTSPSEGEYLKYTSGEWVNVIDNGDIFGDNFKENFRDEFDSNSSSSFEEYLRLEDAACVVGRKIRIGVFVIWAMSSTSSDYEADLYVEESGQSPVKVGELRQEAQDSGTDQKISSSGFFYYTPSVSTQLDIYIEYRSEGGNATAYTWYAGIETWRVQL